MTFAYQILSMTNYCNLRCAYCDWEKVGGFPLSGEQLACARYNIHWARQFADKNCEDLLLGVYSGGEPFVFPELVEIFLQEFSDKWVRISTNGLFDADRCLPMLKRHGKVILTASLDGIDLESNRARFSSKKQLQTVLKNIQQALDQGILVMILCTINRFNIDTFFEFADGLYKSFRTYIDQGRLVMPAHFITAYTTPVGIPNPKQEARFLERLDWYLQEGHNPVISKVDWHYRRLGEYVRTKEHTDCQVCDWSKCAHFLGDNMIKQGEINTYLCPMRGYGDLGTFKTGETVDSIADTYKEQYQKEYQLQYGAGKSCRCFVDWTAFDLVLQDKVSLERAKEWFRFFRDPVVQDWIDRFQAEKKEK